MVAGHVHSVQRRAGIVVAVGMVGVGHDETPAWSACNEWVQSVAKCKNTKWEIGTEGKRPKIVLNKNLALKATKSTMRQTRTRDDKSTWERGIGIGAVLQKHFTHLYIEACRSKPICQGRPECRSRWPHHQ